MKPSVTGGILLPRFPSDASADELKENDVMMQGNPTGARPAMTWRREAWLPILSGVLVAVALVLFGRTAGRRLPEFAMWVAGLGPWGPIVFIAGYTVATIALVPGSALTLAAGAIFGLTRGVIYTFIGATLGASVAFLISRYVARSAVERRLADSPHFAAIDRAIATYGRRIVFLLRLSPVFPFNLLNYGLGLTKVRFVDYAAASVGMLPGTLLYVYYGKVAGDLAALIGGAGVERGSAYFIWLAAGLIATVAVTAIVTRLARAALP
jgi:uncharacterized membrane protein YdjX (TVP38/TMEM64 family)